MITKKSKFVAILIVLSFIMGGAAGIIGSGFHISSGNGLSEIPNSRQTSPSKLISRPLSLNTINQPFNFLKESEIYQKSSGNGNYIHTPQTGITTYNVEVHLLNFNSRMVQSWTIVLQPTDNPQATCSESSSQSYLNYSLAPGSYFYYIELSNNSNYESQFITLKSVNGTFTVSANMNLTINLPQLYVSTFTFSTNLGSSETFEEALFLYDQSNGNKIEVTYTNGSSYSVFTLAPHIIVVNGTFGVNASLNLKTVKTTLNVSGENALEDINFYTYYKIDLAIENISYSNSLGLRLSNGSSYTCINTATGSSEFTNLSFPSMYFPRGVINTSILTGPFNNLGVVTTEKMVYNLQLAITGQENLTVSLSRLEKFQIPVKSQKSISMQIQSFSGYMFVVQYSNSSFNGNLDFDMVPGEAYFSINYNYYSYYTATYDEINTASNISLNFINVTLSFSNGLKNGTLGANLFGSKITALTPFYFSSVSSANNPGNTIIINVIDETQYVLLSEMNSTISYSKFIMINPSLESSYVVSQPDFCYLPINIGNEPSNSSSIVTLTHENNTSNFIGHSFQSSGIEWIAGIFGRDLANVQSTLSTGETFSYSIPVQVKSGETIDITIPTLQSFKITINNIPEFLKLSQSSSFMHISLVFDSYERFTLSNIVPSQNISTNVSTAEITLNPQNQYEIYLPYGTYYSQILIDFFIFSLSVIDLPNASFVQGASYSFNFPQIAFVPVEESGINLASSFVTASGQNYCSFSLPLFIFGAQFSMLSNNIYSITPVDTILLVENNTLVTVTSTSLVQGIYVTPAIQSSYVSEVAIFSINLSPTNIKTYNLEFREKGLPSGTVWKVSVVNDTSGKTYNLSSNTQIISAYLPNGSYSYNVTEISGYNITNSSGSITIKGTNITENITFTPIQRPLKLYGVTFTETGLPSGTKWSVTLNGSSLSSTSSSISFKEANGSYTYSVSSISGYTITNSTGTVTVNGNNITVRITFTSVKTPFVEKYNVTFTETGLPSGKSWSVTLNGSTVTSTTSTITFTEPNGTYSYSIGSVSGYTVSKSTGPVTVNGNNITVSITFSSTSSSPPAKQPSSGISSTELYAIIGAVVAVAAIAIAILFLVRRK